MKFWEMFLGADGKVSAMRVASLFIVFCVLGVFVGHNVMAMIRGQCGFVSMSWEAISLVAGVLGVKAYQHKHENGSTEEEETPTPPKEPPTSLPANELPKDN